MTTITSTLVAIAWLGAANPADAKPSQADVQQAEETARAWLGLVDDGRYAESWTDAAALFRQSVRMDQWVQQISTVRAPFGKVLKRQFRSATPRTSLPGAPDGEYVVLQYDTDFEHKKAAVETVTPMRDPDGRWRVSGYFVR
ncbi:MAG TPA: DUF4019 domain-containing protein [Anaeromyxobacteraceae bacterium]|nr:DUF4019 domain-containing protein [Anaeromyxobacteraceae bacterium]